MHSNKSKGRYTAASAMQRCGYSLYIRITPFFVLECGACYDCEYCHKHGIHSQPSGINIAHYKLVRERMGCRKKQGTPEACL